MLFFLAWSTWKSQFLELLIPYGLNNTLEHQGVLFFTHVIQNSFHGGILTNRKCLFNSQLKVEGMFTRRSCLKDGEQKTRFLEGGWDGEEDEVHEEERLRAERGRDRYLALSQVCATGGSERKWVYGGSERESVCVYVCMSVLTCQTGHLSFPCCSFSVSFHPAWAPQLPFGAASLLPWCMYACVSECVRARVCSGPSWLRKTDLPKGAFCSFLQVFISLFLMFYWDSWSEGRKLPAAIRSRRGHQRKRLLQCQQEVMPRKNPCYPYSFN